MGRQRSNSVKVALEQIPAATVSVVASPSFVQDLHSFKWMTSPTSSLKLILLLIALHCILILINSPTTLESLFFISYKIPQTTYYDKGIKDINFLFFYIILFSFLRQIITEKLVKPLATNLGITTEAKLARFMEQGYAFLYFTASASLGLYVMKDQNTWWYNTKYYWIHYPHWQMTAPLKSYYLLQFAYWCQQMLVLVLRIEKPRSDFYELVLHHLVTLWLVGWSYTLNLTMIGTAVFVSMDVPDVFLAFSKCLNYLELQRISELSFVWFLIVWHYMRHYLNLKILYSVHTEFDEYVPAQVLNWEPKIAGQWWIPFGITSGVLPSWIRNQIFLPIFLLQLVNLFWSYLIWRVLFRMIFKGGLVDVREEGESEITHNKEKHL